jgi:hypothetical protein
LAVPGPSGQPWLSTWMPGSASSHRMIPEIAPPMIPATIAKIR